MHVEVAPVLDLEVAQSTVVFAEIFKVIDSDGSVEDGLGSGVERLKVGRAIEIGKSLKVSPLGRDLIGVVVQIVLPELIHLGEMTLLAPLAYAKRNGGEVAGVLPKAGSRGICVGPLLLGHVLELGTVERGGHGISTGEAAKGFTTLTTISAQEIRAVGADGGEESQNCRRRREGEGLLAIEKHCEDG